MHPPTDCPRCGQAGVTEETCPRCGVIVAKARARTAPPLPARAAGAGEADVEGTAGPGRLTLVLGAALLVLAGAIGSRLWERSRPRAPGVASGATAAPPAAAGDVPGPLDTPPLPFNPAPPAPAAHIDLQRLGAPDPDRRRADELARKLSTPASVTAADVRAAEDLLERHPGERPLRDLLEHVLLAVAYRHATQRQHAQAVAYLQRAQQVQPTSLAPSLALLRVSLEAEEWPGAEAAARAVLALAPDNFEAWRGLGYALFRQDRSREAAEALRAALGVRDDGATRLLLERVQKGLADERGMAERRISHFSVRYDGGEHEEVGREVLRALERHFATLAVALDYQPANPVPVILFTRESYYDASGAPAWSGGNYDRIDGRIRIPIGGLTASLSPGMDETLIHELTHAFVAARTRDQASHELHEGLAQYMEGKRLDAMLDNDTVTALADGRIGGVAGFYLAALAFVEHLIGSRGLGGINELLKVMGETGSQDEAFRQVHGADFRATHQAWARRFRQQRGSR